ncbi:MAG: hypothetical protein HY901_00025 [Deltaproteobacteria bacterium]|nr:hypothetical protein [Deltaproteobacteria bacterium]
MRLTLLSLLLALPFAACGSGTSEGGPDSGRSRADAGDAGGEEIIGNPDGGPGAGDTGWVDPCSEEAKLVYVVDSDNTFSSFDPRKLKNGADPFVDLGELDCPVFGAAPFSMSVDRSAVAWVLYNNGMLFKVDTRTLHCQATSYTPDPNLKLFGMGFVSDAPGVQAETLFIAGGVEPSTTENSTLAKFQLAPSFEVTTVGAIPGWPELTGTGDAKLWGFFPDLRPPKVAQIDKTSGDDLRSFPAPSLQGTPSSWAFAFWGGDFWIFLKRHTESSTQVHRMKSATGVVDTPLPDTGRRIVGAGVSTCAPTEIN